MNRNRHAASAVLIAAGLATACLSPTNIQGVAFTSGETIDYGALAACGQDGVNYLREEDSARVSFRYVSHASPDAMVYVGNYGLSYASGVNVTCMGVILDTAAIPDSVGIYGELPREVFDYSEAVIAELDWLVAHSILSITPAGLQAAKDSLRAAANGGQQYWTLQEALLSYNMWYEYDSQSGVWGVDSPNGVRGVYGGCSILDIAFELAAEPLAGSSVASRRARSAADGLATTRGVLVVGRGGTPPGSHAYGLDGAVVKERTASAGTLLFRVLSCPAR